MTTFKIPIDYDSVSSEAGGFIVDPSPIYQIELEIAAANSSSGMGDIMAFQEYIKKDLNSVIVNLQSSCAFSPAISMSSKWKFTTLDVTIVIDPLIKNVNQFIRLIEEFLKKKNMYLRQALISSRLNDMDQAMSWSSEPTFRYKPTKIQCDDCHEEFLHTELKRDNAIWGEGDYEKNIESDKVCPKCGAWDCCELEFEQLPS